MQKSRFSAARSSQHCQSLPGFYGKINGIHNSDVLVGFLDFDMRFTTVVGGNTVSVTLYTDGRVLIQNCPVGTGQLTIDLSRGIYLILISVPELDNTGASS